jgi:hypothetical protein
MNLLWPGAPADLAWEISEATYEWLLRIGVPREQLHGDAAKSRRAEVVRRPGPNWERKLAAVLAATDRLPGEMKRAVPPRLRLAGEFEGPPVDDSIPE